MSGKNKEKETNQDLLKCVERIALDIKSSGISKEMLLKNKSDLQNLSNFLDISQTQVILFSTIFTINFGSCTVDLENIADYIGCSPVSVVSYLPDLDIMVEKKLLRRQVENNRRRRGGGGNLNNIEFYVNREAFESLRKGEKFISKKIETPDVYSLMVYFDSVFQNFHNGEYTIPELHNEILSTLNRNIDLPFVKELRKFPMEIEDLTFFILICSEYMDEEESVNLLNAIKYH